MLYEKLNFFLKRRCCTLLGVGPMSKNCVDASIELANEKDIPIMLIASKRQIECDFLGGGYVNNWDTASFSRYVLENDKKGMTILSRDHGGPFQRSEEIQNKFSLRQSMECAKKSFEIDICSGFEIIHIDPSIDPFSSPDQNEILNRVFELMEFCCLVAKREGKNILFEIGTEEQGSGLGTIEEMNSLLESVKLNCSKYNLPYPTFIVLQTGTKVMECQNVGTFNSEYKIENEIPSDIQIPKIIDLCNKHGIFLKQHNTDYLGDQTLRWHPKYGIHSANVAPEFGVAETVTLLNILRENNLSNLADVFLEISYASKKWDKWLIPGSGVTDEQKAIISGHYVFSHPGVIELKAKAARDIQGDALDIRLKEAVKQSISRYLVNFRLI
jgi:hypothetical protein